MINKEYTSHACLHREQTPAKDKEELALGQARNLEPDPEFQLHALMFRQGLTTLCSWGHMASLDQLFPLPLGFRT